jgi:hypothetical protein
MNYFTDTKLGGELLVRHGDKELTFDWSTSASKEAQPAVQWAAFYSDCEHEVLEVTSGHRITLTYNLYTTRAAGLLAGQESALDPKKLPLYASLGTALQCPDFLPGGKMLSILAGPLYKSNAAQVACSRYISRTPTRIRPSVGNCSLAA